MIAAMTLHLHVGSLGMAGTSAITGEQPFVFRSWSGEEAEGFRGSFRVPENRRIPNSRTIQIAYVRFPATADASGPPIVYLAGGPGASGIQAVNYRFPLFMELRQYGDVIALDQRGTGQSNDIPEFHSNQVLPVGVPYSDEEFIEQHRRALREALRVWRTHGIELSGYNTVENARDLDALREHLGSDKLVLWGISYGSHLALAALREIGDRLDRVILVSAEGLDQTIKLPDRADVYLERLQAAIDTQPAAKALYPDVREMMRRVHATLEIHPVPVEISPERNTKFTFLLQRRDLQMLAGSLIADPENVVALLRIYRALDRGEPPTLEGIPSRLLPDHFLSVGQPVSVYAMSTLTDMASGVGSERRAEVVRQARTAVLGDWLDISQHYQGLAPELDLGDGFRTAAPSDVPVLLVSGTLDGRTDIASQSEAVAHLGRVTRIVIENGGHNPSLTPELLAAMGKFLADEPVTQTQQQVALPTFAP